MSNFFDSKADHEKFLGSITFTRYAIQFPGSTILLRNVSKFQMYGIEYIYKYSIFMLIVCGIFFLLSVYNFSHFMWPCTIIGTITGVILFLGIKERLRPKLYGLSLELNSGSTRSFLSSDFNGVQKLFDSISTAIESDSDFKVVSVYNENSVNISELTIGAIGSNSKGTVKN